MSFYFLFYLSDYTIENQLNLSKGIYIFFNFKHSGGDDRIYENERTVQS